MQSSRRYLTLLSLLLLGVCISLGMGHRGSVATARYPTDDAVYQVKGWALEPLDILAWAGPEPGAILQRTYRNPSGLIARLAVWTVPQPQGKTLFRKGADRDVLGDGYTSEGVPQGLVPPGAGRDALIVRRGAERWLLLYSYGERRGLLGSGQKAWGLAEMDALFDRPNDYFLARVAVPIDQDPGARAVIAARLADVLFPQLATWYADTT